MYTCAQCSIYSCNQENPENMPKNCPMREQENHQFYITSSEIEALGYGQWPRVKETIILCKNMGYQKVGLSEDKKIHSNSFEPMCNPVAQAQFLNSQQTEFNIALGLCVGHDSMFYKYSDAMVTTLIAKDRVLAHNPAGALYCAEGYFKENL